MELRRRCAPPRRSTTPISRIDDEASSVTVERLSTSRLMPRIEALMLAMQRGGLLDRGLLRVRRPARSRAMPSRKRSGSCEHAIAALGEARCAIAAEALARASSASAPSGARSPMRFGVHPRGEVAAGEPLELARASVCERSERALQQQQQQAERAGGRSGGRASPASSARPVCAKASRCAAALALRAASDGRQRPRCASAEPANGVRDGRTADTHAPRIGSGCPDRRCGSAALEHRGAALELRGIQPARLRFEVASRRPRSVPPRSPRARRSSSAQVEAQVVERGEPRARGSRSRCSRWRR